MPILSTVFVSATVLWTAMSLYLSLRQSAFVMRHRDVVPPQFATVFTSEQHRRAADYVAARETVERWELVAGAAQAIAWAVGAVDLLYGLIEHVLPAPSARGVAFLTAAAAVSVLLSLPFDVYRTFRIEQRFGFNRTSVAQFVADLGKRTIIALALLIPLLSLLLVAMQTFTGLWWLWTWSALVVLMIIAPSVFVRLIAPRFNRFEPLPEGALRSRIEAVLQRCGFRASQLLTMDASRRTARGNAYFIGFGRTKRIVLFDTLLARHPSEEIEAVVAHELGHFHYRHVLYGLVRGAVIMFVVLAGFGWLAKQPWLLPSFGIEHRNDALALFVCSLLASVAGPLLAPLGNWISRRNEYQADDFARRIVGAEPMIGALTRLAQDNAATLTPDPLYSLVHHSHPSIPLRVRRLRSGVETETPTVHPSRIVPA